MLRSINFKKIAKNPDNRFLIVVPAIVVSVLIFIYFQQTFKNYTMLVETRCWINGCLDHTELSTLTSSIYNQIGRLFHQGILPSSRNFTFLNIEVYTYVCGTDLDCQNSFQFFWIAFSSFLISLLLIQMKENFLLAASIGLFWALSLPVYDAIVWQATLHDKLVTGFILLSVNMSYFFVRQKVTVKTIFWSNLLVFLSVLFAYNSKEMSFGLAPVIFILALFFGTEKWKKWLLFIVPFVYAAFHVAYRGYYLLTEPKDTHIFKVGIFEHIFRYLSFYLNRDDKSFGIQMATTALLVFLVYSAIHYRNLVNRKVSFEYKKTVFFFLCWVLIVFPALQTHYPAPFYNLAPAVFFVSFLFLLAKNVAVDSLYLFSAKRSQYSRYAWAIGVVIMGIFFHNAMDLQSKRFFGYVKDAKQTGFIKYSDNVQEAFVKIREKIESPVAEKIHIVIGKNNVGHMFLCDKCTYTFMFDRHDPGQKLDSLIECIDYEKYASMDPSSLEKNYYLLFTTEFALTEIFHGRRKLY